MPDSQRVPVNGNIIGIGYMLIAVAAGLITSFIIKSLSPVATILVILSLRFVFSVPTLAAAAYVKRGPKLLDINRWDRLIMRVIVGQIGIVFWFLSITHTSLGQATALFQSSAIFVTILSPLILREKVGVYRGSAVMLGLIGIIMITNPFHDDLNIGAFYGLCSAIAGAFLVVILRLLGKTEEPVTVALWHNMVGALIYPAVMLAIGEAFIFGAIIDDQLALMCFFGLCATFVQIGFTSAYQHGEAAALAPVRYLSVPMAALAGVLIWGEALSFIEITGMVIVVGSCVFISYREYKLSRRSPAKPAEMTA
ncbi:MAG: DMT family transporter [Alphaproteobacteria bacterium]|nr:DMT family transporter [Alphaproteobacteria bacterium]